jgi:Zinc knuckle
VYSPPVTSSDVQPMELDSITTRTQRRLTPAELEKLKKAGACFTCFKHGHMSRNCPSKQKPTGNQNVTGRVTSVTTVSGVDNSGSQAQDLEDGKENY